MSDSQGILGAVSDDKKRSIIFETPKASLPPAVRALMDKAEERMKVASEAVGDLLGEPLEIDLYVKNNKVLFSMPSAKTAAPALAKAIIKAVQEYEVKPISKKPRTHASARVGEPVVKYDRYVRIDWKQKLIFTNFPPSEGNAFLGALAIVVEELQGGSSKTTEEPKS